MPTINVLLAEEEEKTLRAHINAIITDEVKRARSAAMLDKPFLKQSYMAKFVGVSVNTLKAWERQGLPSIVIDGVKLFSKEEVSKWILQHQK